MSENKRLKNYDDLPLVLDVADIRRIMGISRVAPTSWFTRLVFQRLEAAG